MDVLRSLLCPNVCFRAPNRSLLRIFGDDGAKFLQGLFTNDVLAFSKDKNRALQWNSLLNAKGKVVIPDLFLLKMGPMSLDHKYTLCHSNIHKKMPEIFESGEFLLDCPSTDFSHLLKFLGRYKLRSNVGMEPVDPRDVQVRVIFGEKLSHGDSHWSDVRHSHLGRRIYCGPECDGILTEEGLNDIDIDILTDSDKEKERDAWERYSAIRMGVGQAEGSVEIGQHVMNVFEANLVSSDDDLRSSVSFKKGCFLGQERIGRRKRDKAVPSSKRLTGLSWVDDSIGSALVQGTRVFGVIEGKRVPCGVIHSSVASKRVALATVAYNANEIQTEDGKHMERVVA
eukprot:TRINITY_DN143_c1_g2_i1.p1 TRINITY_DN143_c1_g2~~TRINITY_DN143_c1_g2_i1.p1  ORF type:complete len:341 (+),score=82.78 TRINITY_DN143_c1_g2_i1:65-1087(+)